MGPSPLPAPRRHTAGREQHPEGPIRAHRVRVGTDRRGLAGGLPEGGVRPRAAAGGQRLDRLAASRSRPSPSPSSGGAGRGARAPVRAAHVRHAVHPPAGARGPLRAALHGRRADPRGAPGFRLPARAGRTWGGPHRSTPDAPPEPAVILGSRAGERLLGGPSPRPWRCPCSRCSSPYSPYRTGSWAPGQPLCHFGDIRQAIDNGRLASTLADTDRDPAAALTADLTETSRIAARKHQWIRTGLIALCTGTALLPTPLLIG
ncbi:DUF5706 domain-containing protein [Streptomyces sp. NBC_00401]|nr:DUF5706 domain-containing protein [Streptomyces sp. NBC_00401]